ncbi:MAG: SUMF1/EgtB/PvdO family nonheme iron enzyme [Labilithrix sp.]|nr:SUMF1/EgtB/PvdO family nonheme iron enzyme [Labilithrix sp.]
MRLHHTLSQRAFHPVSLAAKAVLLAAACSGPDPVPASQVLLVIETDAPIPRARLAGDDLVLFDRLRVSVHGSGDEKPCVGCTRDFALAADQDEISVGVAPTNGSAVVHVELYAERNLDAAGAPDVGSSLSAWVRLPPTAARELRRVRTILAMATLGEPRGSREEPVDGDADVVSVPARWPDAKVVPCTAPLDPDEACVPGGVVWMGNALRRPGPAGGIAPRLVRISPFRVDLHEVTVGELRASGLAVSRDDETDPGVAPESPTCTYSALAGADEDLPVNCISHALAEAFCRARGKTLPTEAQREYLGGGLRGALYPWGNDDPSCDDVVFGRSRGSLGPCIDRPERPAPVGSARRDVLLVGGRPVVDLAGNLGEWAREPYVGADAPCHHQGYLVDPVCEAGAAGAFVSRGGSYADVPLGLRAEVRFPARQAVDIIGFRCARDAR